MSVSSDTSSAAMLWTTPLATATAGPPRSCFVTSSPSEASTTGGPAVKIAASPVITDQSHSGAVMAPWPAEEPITPHTIGT